MWTFIENPISLTSEQLKAPQVLLLKINSALVQKNTFRGNFYSRNFKEIFINMKVSMRSFSMLIIKKLDRCTRTNPDRKVDVLMLLKPYEQSGLKWDDTVCELPRTFILDDGT